MATTKNYPDTADNSSAKSARGELDHKPTIEQVAWVFERLNLALDRRVTFRFLIYDLMGFGLDAYKPLYLAGGMNIINALYCDEDIEKEQALQRQEVIAELRQWVGDCSSGMTSMGLAFTKPDLFKKLDELDAKRPASKAGK